MKSYPLVSSLAEIRNVPKAAVASRLGAWLKEKCRPAAPSKPIEEMTDEEFERLNLF